ncbi:hypothetical protein AQJ30_32045 [Streptomyces longwoodensis]|uniref:Uncharacterized protein n=1 Tax=Streptomyces longwoodensis TaxID=68231 RepID=A0A117QKU3_9ACTN|nr:hypothetical protein AQJ30_32045 [Streptomyces longwoodensis]
MWAQARRRRSASSLRAPRVQAVRIMRRAWSVIRACASSARKRIGRSRVPVAVSAPLVAYLAMYAATARSVSSWPPSKSADRIVRTSS